MIRHILGEITTVYEHNPVWQMEKRRINGGMKGLERHAWRMLAYPALAVALIAALDVFINSGKLTIASFSLPIMLLFSTALMFGADVAYVLNTVNALSGPMITGEWELLRLTPLRPQMIFDAKYAAAQLKAWRLLWFEIAVRLITLELVSLPLLLLIGPTQLTGATVFLVLNPLPLLAVGILLSFLVVFVLEPYWRMRMVVAIGLAVSAMFRSASYAVLAGILVTLVIRMMQVGVLLLTVSMFSIFGEFTLLFLCALPFALSIIFGGSWYIYAYIRTRALRLAFRVAFAADK